jgi:putative transposase
LSREYPPKSTCYYWFRKLSKMSAWKETYMLLFEIYKKYFSNNLNTVVVDGTFVKAVKGGTKIGNTKIGVAILFAVRYI